MSPEEIREALARFNRQKTAMPDELVLARAARAYADLLDTGVWVCVNDGDTRCHDAGDAAEMDRVWPSALPHQFCHFVALAARGESP